MSNGSENRDKGDQGQGGKVIRDNSDKRSIPPPAPSKPAPPPKKK